MRAITLALIAVASIGSHAAAQQVVMNRAPVQAQQKPLFETCLSLSSTDPRLGPQPGLNVRLMAGNVQQQGQATTLTGTVAIQQAVCNVAATVQLIPPAYTLRDGSVTLQRTVTSSTTVTAPSGGNASASTSASAGVKVGGQQVSSTTVKAGVASAAPSVALEQAYLSMKGTGKLEIDADGLGTVVVIEELAFEASGKDGGKIMVQAGVLKAYGCAMRLTPGFAIDRDALAVSGKLSCGEFEFANAKLKHTPLTKTTGSGEIKLYGLPFNVAFSTDQTTLKATGRWAGSSRDFVRLPALPGLELRVTGPVATLTILQKRTGPNTISRAAEAMFDAERVELRTEAKMPSGEPWLSAYVDPGPSTMSASGTVLALPTLASVINDPFKAARDTCLAAADKVPNNPATTKNDEHADAINACNAASPKPPSVPSAPKTISIDVTIAVR